jgi:hypothetical protein
MMKKRFIFATALVGTLLLAVPLQSQAFFGFFGGGFSFGFGTGWGGWGGPGWWGGPGGWGPGWWGRGWYRPGYYGWYRPYGNWHYWRRFDGWHGWPYLGYGPPLYYPRLPLAEEPAATAPTAPKEK